MGLDEDLEGTGETRSIGKPWGKRIPAVLVLIGVVAIFASFAMASFGTPTGAFGLMFVGALLIVGGLVLGVRSS